MFTFKIKTFGCKVNQSDSKDIENIMLSLGLNQSYSLNNSNLIIINICSVTKKASIESKQTIKKILKKTHIKIVIIGCFSDIFLKEIAKTKKIYSIIPNKLKHRISKKYFNIKIKKNRNFDAKINRNILINNNDFEKINNKIRTSIKIQDGCNSFCTYCTVPYTRGKSKSYPEKQILNKIKKLGKLGYKEIVLTGVNIGNYGNDIYPNTNIYKLLYNVIKQKDIERIRISSIEPCELSNKIIRLIRDTEIKKNYICQHLHIPLQSGDNFILQNMKRPYNRKYYVKLIKKILHFIPNCSIGTDLLIGFPGETSESFDKTYNLIKKIQISYLHVFPFSPRKGTAAYYFKDAIPRDIIKKRCKIMRILGKEKRKSYYNKFIGKFLPVLVEGKKNNTDKMKGITSNYIPIFFSAPDSTFNTIQYVKINRVSSEGYVEGIWQKKII